MSWENLKDAYRTRLGNLTAKSVLVLIVDEANAEGLALANLERIAELTEVGGRTVERIVQAFADIALLEWTEMLFKGKMRPAFQVDLGKLGTDLTKPFDEAYVALQSKRRGPDGKLRPCVKRRSDGGEDVAATEKSVAATEKSVAATEPPNPHIGVPPSVPFVPPSPVVPSEEGTGGEDLLELAFTAEQQAHLDKLDGGKREFYAEFYRGVNRATAAEEAEAARKLRERLVVTERLKAAMPTVELACEWVMRQCRMQPSGRKRGIEHVIELAIREDGREPWKPGEAIVQAWDRYNANGHLMRVRYGPLKFIALGLWADERKWPWDEAAVHKQREAAVGSAR